MLTTEKVTTTEKNSLNRFPYIYTRAGEMVPWNQAGDFYSWLCHLIAAWPRRFYVTSLNLCFLSSAIFLFLT